MVLGSLGGNLVLELRPLEEVLADIDELFEIESAILRLGVPTGRCRGTALQRGRRRAPPPGAF